MLHSTEVRPTPLDARTKALVYTEKAFSRQNEDTDTLFYARERMVSHVDDVARATIRELIGALVVEPRPAILDLMASWDSHLPADLAPSRLTCLGLNETELEANAASTERLIHDLNQDPRLPLPHATFDVVLNTVSVDYLTRPFEVFGDVGRVLKPGGLVLVVFSNRMFPEKAVRIWREASEQERIFLVEDYLQDSGRFEESELWIAQGRPRPSEDRYASLGLPSDPVYAVYAERKGGLRGRQRRRPPGPVEAVPGDDAEVRHRQSEIGRTLCCPYCSTRLRRWAVPQTPFTEYDVEFLRVCFNDRCSFLVRGFDAMARQGNLGFSHRFMYIPEHDVSGSLPVPSLYALRSSIVDDEPTEDRLPAAGV
jgi:SAM-dependent methyltransferase